MPYFVVWKNGIPAGKPYDGLVSSLDIFATAIDAAGISKTRNRLDGVSLLPYLKGKKGNPIKCYTGVKWIHVLFVREIIN